MCSHVIHSPVPALQMQNVVCTVKAGYIAAELITKSTANIVQWHQFDIDWNFLSYPTATLSGLVH